MTDKVTNELLLEEIKKSRQELKASLEALEIRILMKIEETNHRIREVERKCANLSDKIEYLEIKGKENNIVIFGLQKTPAQITLDIITNEIQRLLNIELNASDINNFYPLGKGENCPVKLELVSYLKKASILRSTKKLKGTNISIANDMTLKQRMDYKILRKHLDIAKQNKENNCYIKRNKLHVNNRTYTPQDLEQLEDIQDNITQLQSKSEPGTPVAPTNLISIQQTRHQLQQNQSNSNSTTPRDSPKGKREERDSVSKIGKGATKEVRVITRSRK